MSVAGVQLETNRPRTSRNNKNGPLHANTTPEPALRDRLSLHGAHVVAIGMRHFTFSDIDTRASEDKVTQGRSYDALPTSIHAGAPIPFLDVEQ